MVKLTVILLFLSSALVVLLGRVIYFKEVHGQEYETVAKTQQVSKYDTIISPNRGSIVDRNKYALAVSTTVYNIVMDVRVLADYSTDIQEKTISALSEVLELDYNDLKGYVTKDPATGKPALDTNWKVLKKGCSKEIKDELESRGLKGVVYEKDTKRSYPTGTTAAQTIGFVRDVSWGIEKYYGKYMEGTPGRSFITYDSSGNVNAIEMDAKDGSTIVTTLDYIIQQYAENAVKEAMESYNPENAAVMVMNPNTGEILAMAQGPTFDPNDPATPIYLENKEFSSKWDAMSDEEKYEYLNSVWKNFNVSSTYEPGSIFKPITAAAALEEGVIEPDSTFYCSGSTTVADRSISCHLRSGHGTVDLEHALSESCNMALISIAQKLGTAKFYKYQKEFGFGEKTGIDLPGEESASGLMYSEERINATELATMSFGQSFNCTSIQAITAFSALINGGNIMKPYVVSQIIDSSGAVVLENKPELVRKVISKETSDIIKKYLVTTIETGTGKKAKIEGYTFGGKTGTAEQGVRGSGEHTVSFIGYIPADNPEYIVMTVIHKPESYADGVTTAAPMMKSMMENIIKYKSIEPSASSENGNSKSSNKVKIGDYKGTNLFNTLYELDSAGLSYEVVGSGNLITNQVPAAGTEVEKGSKLLIYVTKAEGEEDGIKVPDVRGLSYEEAVSEINGAGLSAVIKGDEENGTVKSQSPAYGLYVEEGSEVTLNFE